MTEVEYDKYYIDYKESGRFNSNIIREYLYEIGKDFNLNIFFQALNILNNPFASMDANLEKFVGIDYQKIMVDRCLEYFDNKFYKQRYTLDFRNTDDKRLLKKLFERHSTGIIYI